MQKSKSTLSFAPSTEHTELVQRTRPRSRTSLDTFVIPGRTRLPSSKPAPDSTDIQVAQALLDHNLLLQHSENPTPIAPMATRGDPGRRCIDTSRGNSSSLHPSNRQSSRVPPPHWALRSEVDPRLQTRPPRRVPEVLVISPHHRNQTDHTQSTPKGPMKTTTAIDPEPAIGRTYDGAADRNDKGYMSRMTSMTWSTVSQRVLSDSSGSSRASMASDFRHEYNQLAERHGLLPITGESSEEGSNSSQTKVTQKTQHHHGWLARKLFRRSSSTYTLKEKTTYKPITRKKSFGGIHLLSGNAPTSIISGQSLEEMCRLGGMGILTLPYNFAADRLSLPTCLSATAAHLLEHGCNAPGIFRVSGTTTTINELYRHFDTQFSDAGSPSKVEATVGTGQLPSEPEFSLPDIASLFKKIIIGLPGGLLGSLELFEVLSGIVRTWKPDPKLSVANPVRLRARAIALAILSVTSAYRAYLIQAVLGLVAYFGFEADKAQEADKNAIESRPGQHQLGSELMGYQSLGKVLGPLLLGDLTHHIDVRGDASSHDDPTGNRKSAEHPQDAKKSKKQKRNSVPNKLERDDTLTAHVDRANLAAEVMHMLLLNWREVVKQLRELNGLSSLMEHSKASTRNKKLPTQIANTFTLNTSEENVHFMDILRGRSLPEELKGPVKMKRTVRITSRSPMSRGALTFGGDEDRSWFPEASEMQNEVRPRTSPSGSNAAESGPHNTGADANDGSFVQEGLELDTEKRTKSDLAMDQMAMGTILTPLEDTNAQSDKEQASRRASSPGTPLIKSRTPSSSDEPETAVKATARPRQRRTSIRLVSWASIDKPLPPIGDAQRVESRSDSRSSSRPESLVDQRPPTAQEEEEARIMHEKIMSNRRPRRSHPSHASVDSSPYATRQESPRTLFPSRSSGHWTPPNISRDNSLEKEADFPRRQSSLPSEQVSGTRSIDPLPTFETLAEHKAWRNSSLPPPVMPPTSRKVSNAPSNDEDGVEREKRNSAGSVRFLAHKFAEASRVTRNDEQARHATKNEDKPKIYAYVRPILSPGPYPDDPFTSSPTRTSGKCHSPDRETMIPKPIQEVGHGRKVESPRSPVRTVSPPKPVIPSRSKGLVGKRPSVFNIICDQDTENIETDARTDKSVHCNAEPITVQDSTQETSRKSKPPGHLESIRTGSNCQSPRQVSDGLPHLPFSYESIRDVQMSPRPRVSQQALRIMPTGHPLSKYQVDDTASENHYLTPSSPSRINTYTNASDALKKLERHGSINATLYQEIMRLQRLLEHRGEEVQAARKSLEVVREARDTRDVIPGKSSPKNSWGKTTKRGDSKEAERELEIWKRRAVEAERRLADIQPLTETIAEKHGVSVDVLLGSGGGSSSERQGVDVEVLVDRAGQERQRVAELYVGEGWGGDALTLSDEDIQKNFGR